MHSTSVSRSSELITGFTSPLRVLKLLLEHPHLVALFLLPMGLTLVIISIVIYALLAGLWSTSQQFFLSTFGSTSLWGGGILSVLAALVLLYFAGITLNIFIQLAASPFNDLLAEKTEVACGEKPEGIRLNRLLKVFWIDLKKTIFTLSLTLICLLIGLIPGIGLLSILGLAWIQAFTFLSYPLSRRTLGLRGSLKWMNENIYRAMGFGLATLLLFTIPVINLFALPVAVIAGTLTYLKK